jgi:hypothetical protein
MPNIHGNTGENLKRLDLGFDLLGKINIQLQPKIFNPYVLLLVFKFIENKPQSTEKTGIL